MMETYKLVTVKSKYCDYLRKYDYRVSFNAKEKELRPFVGVLFEIDNMKYFAPLSSPKEKHLKMKNTVDFYKIDGGKLGAINFNNMIPIPETEYEYIDTNVPCLTNTEKKYQEMLKDQLRWLNRDGKGLKIKAKTLYMKSMNNELPKKIIDRCCNFLMLERKCIEYNRVKAILPELKYIKDENDLFYLYDNLFKQEYFEAKVKEYDTPEKCETIQNLTIEEINKSYDRSIDIEIERLDNIEIDNDNIDI